MKQLYRWAQEAFEKRNTESSGHLDKVYQMGHIDGYLDGFRAAKQLAANEAGHTNLCHPVTFCYSCMSARDILKLGESEVLDK